MPALRRTGLAVAIAGSAVAGTVLPFTAHAETAVLYVDNTHYLLCSDTGPGTRAQPFCTIQAAADVAEPGQTVDIAAGHDYIGQVTVKRSGLPGRPIVFKSDVIYRTPHTFAGTRSWRQGDTPAPHAFLFDGVHDVTVTGLNLAAPQETVLVKDSARIVLDRTGVSGGDPVSNGVRAYPEATPSIRITGTSTDVTVSRTEIFGAPVAGVAVDARVTGTVITTNLITEGKGRGVVATDAPGTVVVGNTFARNCRTDLELTGNSTGAVVENNILTRVPAAACDGTTPTAIPLVVSAGSAQGAKADYNTVVPAGADAYSWGGTAFATPEAFRTTGQGVHDNSVDPQFTEVPADYTPPATAALTDAADTTAPGMPTTDLYGAEPADHPDIPNTGTAGYRDRGAVELQDPMSVRVSAVPYYREGRPLNARLTVDFSAGWSGTGTLDFGDGSAPLAVGPGSSVVDHDYPAAGTFTAALTGTSRSGLVRTTTHSFTLRQVPSLTAEFSWGTYDRSRARIWVRTEDHSPWPITRRVLDFGDGTAPTVVEGPNPATDLTHEYGVGGRHTITETVTDDHGRSASTSVEAKVSGPVPGVPYTGNFGGPDDHNGLFDNGRWTYSYDKTDTQYSSSWSFGDRGDIPAIGNWDGSCRCQTGIYRPSTATFALQHGDGSVSTVQFGDPGDIPAVGKWDGSNRNDQLAVYRPSAGLLAVRHDDGSVSTLRFGDPGDLPVVGDWDGVHHAQFGVLRPGRNAGDPNLFILRHDDGSVSTATYGEKGDLPVVGDWLGTGRTTYGVFRPSTHVFALSNAYAGRADVAYTLYN
ncbi:right-handed parallel beta-helix repeat-containing protein [Kitasatospora sp. NPDC058218]|uniref:right-handed parallel beta-helix repeat-containing protein n=1 Tax=Kitasatospora sp. NPDC058218 TaxID=3346385 RepID=UPI0036DE02C1